MPNEDNWYRQLDNQHIEDQDRDFEAEQEFREEEAEHDWEAEDDR